MRGNDTQTTMLSGYPVSDCVSAGKALNLMLTNRRSVDHGIGILLKYCESDGAVV